MATRRPRFRLPATAKAGEVIVIKTLIDHPMESGLRKDEAGLPIPRSIIARFAAEFEGEPVFACDLGPGISADPFFEFRAKVTRSGVFRFVWVDDAGAVFTEDAAIEVS